LLGNDLLGFHTQHHCDNFINSVDRSLECKIDRTEGIIEIQGHKTIIKPYPISIDFNELVEKAKSHSVISKEKEMKKKDEKTC